MKFTAIDFETANRSPISACSVGLVMVENNAIVKKQSFLIKPPSSYFEFTDIHGITWNDVREVKTFKEQWENFTAYFDGIDFLAAHNAPFDQNVLRSCCTAYGLSYPDIDFRCTVKLSRSVLGIRPANLFNVCRELFIPLNHHDALSDSEACARIMIEVLERQNGSGK
jgi:DNA polymerase III subunit epsilon